MKQSSPLAVDEGALKPQDTSSLESRNSFHKLEWLKDAGFGLFIHWSLDVQLGCVISHSLVGASDSYIKRYYEELPQTFCPTDWDADRVARLAKVAGVQYAVFTTKHHNGFCMWGTKTTSFHVLNTPYGKDIVRQYVDAFRKYGLKVGFYYSPEDFRFLYDHGLTITRTPVEPYAPEIMREYRAYLRAQLEELLTQYGPINLIFFDGGEAMCDENGESLQAFCKNLAWDLQKDILVTRGAIPTPEQHLPGVGSQEVWEACITLSTAWGYQPTNETVKSGAQVIQMLARTRAMGGALLLNIGPDSDGRIPAEQEGVLREVGLWNFINREAILGVRPWILAEEGPMILLADKQGTTLYAVVLHQDGWDRGMRREFVLQSVCATPESEVSVLGASGELTEYRPDLDAHSSLSQQEDGLHVSVMNAQRIYCGIQWRNPLVIRITHVKPAFEPMGIRTGTAQCAQGTAVLHAQVLQMGSFKTANVRFEWRKYPGFALAANDEGWLSTPPIAVRDKVEVQTVLEGLEPATTYQYRAVIENAQNRMRGDNAQFDA